ncbi:MAG: hypothetical protein II998_02405 [Clostridia bacterium]|nr:hypothetical protein [Clostridia bacterium]
MNTSYSNIKKVLCFGVLATVAISFTACTGSSDESVSKSDVRISASSSLEYADEFAVDIEKPVTSPDGNSKRLKPDISNVSVPAPSTAVKVCKTEAECVEMICKFANPNGNWYDALSVLGDFRYSDMEEEAKNKRMQAASEEWHTDVVTKVGEKCIVKMSVEETTVVDINDVRVLDCAQAIGITPDAYSNVKCNISTNYADNMLTVSIDLVKVNGSWYLAKDSGIYDILNVITYELFI